MNAFNQRVANQNTDSLTGQQFLPLLEETYDRTLFSFPKPHPQLKPHFLDMVFRYVYPKCPS